MVGVKEAVPVFEFTTYPPGAAAPNGFNVVAPPAHAIGAHEVQFNGSEATNTNESKSGSNGPFK